MDPTAQLRAFLLAITPIPEDLLARFLAEGRPERLAEGETFCALGERHHRLAFVHRGLLRYHYPLPDGSDVTKDFGLASNFAVSFGSAVQGQPAAVAISAVEDTELTTWDFAAVRARFTEDIAWERLGRLIAERMYIRKEQREFALLQETAAERYARARRLFGAQLARIPLYQLASYLGITPESLSRLRKRERQSQTG